jgi:hypothetical protein
MAQPISSSTAPVPPSTLDRILTAQLAVAWAGELGDDPRLGWWRTDLVSEFGGQDLFQRLLPNTWEWAVLQGARQAARSQDAAGRSKDHDPDRLYSLFRLGFELDERLDERLRDLKDSGRRPVEALPDLRDVITEDWDPAAFSSWVEAHQAPEPVAAPAGRRLKGQPPVSLELMVEHLVGALAPLAGDYPLPHYRKTA